MKKEIKIKALVICPFSKTVLERAQNGAVDIPFVVAVDNTKRCFFAYAEDLLPEHKVGRVDFYDGKELRKDMEAYGEMEDIIGMPYEMRVTGVDEKGYLTGILEAKEAVRKVSSGETKALAEAWEKAYALGGPFTKEYHDTVMQFFQMHGVEEDLQLRIVSGYTLPIDEDGKPLQFEKPASMWLPTDTPNERGLYFASYAAIALEQAMDGNPFIFEEPKSVGKNFLDEWVAYVLGGIYYEISVDPDMVKAELYGDKVIDDASAKKLSKADAEAYLCYTVDKQTDYLPEAANYEYLSKYTQTMRFVVETTEFKRWLRQKSGRRVLMVNEINYGNPTVLAVVFNRVAEDRPVRFIDVPGEGRIYVGRDCILTASMNRDYVGTTELNEAMRSRFGVIEMQPSSHIAGILKDKIESEFGEKVLPQAYYKTCDDLYAYMLARTGQQGNAAQYGDKAISIRSFIRALRTVAVKAQQGKLKEKMLCAQLNVQLRGQCDSEIERASLTDDINDKIGNL